MIQAIIFDLDNCLSVANEVRENHLERSAAIAALK